MLLACRESLVRLNIHQRIHLLHALLIDIDLGDPASAVAVVLGHLVEGAWLLLQGLVHGGDLTLDRGVDVGGALDGLDGAEGVALLDPFAAHLGQFSVDDVAELFGSVLGDSNDGGFVVGGEVNPLVLLGVSLRKSYYFMSVSFEKKNLSVVFIASK